MKIIILTGRFGMGHVTAALAIKQLIEASPLEADVEVVDWLEYALPKLADKYYSFFHILVNKGHLVYNARYRLLENGKTDQKPELSGYFQRCFTRLIKDMKPDMVISTHPVCSQIMSIYKDKNNSSIPLITYVTDITGHSEWINKNTNLYFVGSYLVSDIFKSKGVPSHKIHVTGLPVRPEFLDDTHHDGETLCSPVRHILVMGGGLGMLPKSYDFYDSLNSLSNTKITIITGKNSCLYNRLKDRYTNLRVLGYVNNICDYMKEADLIITKPGGITTFEAIYSDTPILALNPTLRQEIYNAGYIEEMGIGTVVYGPTDQCLNKIEEILDNYLLYYKENIRKVREYLNFTQLIDILNATIKEVEHAYNRTNLQMYQFKQERLHNINETINLNL